MGNVARIRQEAPLVDDGHGTVTRVEGGLFVVETEARELRAKRATSCLLEPAVGDLVLVTTLPRDRSYVLAVLEREPGARTRLYIDGDLQIQAQGEIGLGAVEGVRLMSGKEVAVVAPKVQVRAADAHIALDRLSYVGSLLRARVEQAKVFGQSCESLFERISQRAKRSYRIIEESDYTRAERVDCSAKTSVTIRGQTTVLVGAQLAKVDGDQIHIG